MASLMYDEVTTVVATLTAGTLCFKHGHRLDFIVLVRIVVSYNGWIGSEDCVTFWCQQRKSDTDTLHVTAIIYLSAIIPLVITRH